MCNQYVPPESYDEFRRVYGYEVENLTGNEPWFDEAFPDRTLPIVRKGGAGLQLVKARWGMPSPPQYVKGADRGAAARPEYVRTRFRGDQYPQWG